MPATQSGSRGGSTAALSLALVVAYAIALQLEVGSEHTTTAVANLGQLAAATAAAASCWWRSRSCTGRWRLSWQLLSGATGTPLPSQATGRAPSLTGRSPSSEGVMLK